VNARPLVVVRPEPGNSQTVAAARAAGLEGMGAPLFVIEPVPWRPPGPAPFDALLLSSANAARHGGEGLDAFAALPVYAVGKATAAAARDAGLTVVATGESGVHALLPLLAHDRRGRVLRLAGRRHVALEPPPGVEIVTEIVYWARPLPLEAGPASALRGGAVVMLHSAEAARHFSGECDRLELDRGAIALACLAPAIAESAGGWREVRVAPRPDDSALLAMAREMCETPRPGQGKPNG
jgi:uroporphyrinogen-III synthase